MQTKNVPFEEIYDVLAVRIVFEPVSRSIPEKNSMLEHIFYYYRFIPCLNLTGFVTG